MKNWFHRFKRKRTLFLALSLFFLSAFPIYKNYMNGEAIDTYQIYKGIMDRNAKFFNPWQYRILCPLMISGMKTIYDHTIDKLIPIKKVIGPLNFHSNSGFTSETKAFIDEIKDPDLAKYLIVFIFFRFLLDLFILIAAFFLFRYFIKDFLLAFLGLILISWSMGNGVAVSPLSFNTYMDNALYLVAGCIIVYRKNPWNILLLTIIGAFNRETSLLIPVLLFVSYMKASPTSNFNLKKITWPPKNIALVSFLSLVAFSFIFIGIRIFFGYQPPAVWKVPRGLLMLKLNTISLVAIKGYFEMFGVFSVFPLICLFKFKLCPRILQIWFVTIVPIWFFIHFCSAPTYQGRLFFVPTFLIFMPMVLTLIQRSKDQDNRLINKNSVPTV